MAKRGRPRKKGDRHKCDKLIRTEQDKPDFTAKQARMRIGGMSKLAAGKQLTVLHALYENGVISLSQRDAGIEWAEIAEDYGTAILKPRQRSASDYGGIGGFDNSEGDEPGYVAWCEKAKERYREARRVVLEAGPASLAAMEMFAERDGYSGHLIGDYRLGANAISRLRNSEKRSKVA